MITILYILIAIALILAIYSLWQTIGLRRRFVSALSSQDAGNLESVLASHLTQVKKVAEHNAVLDSAYRKLAAEVSLASQKISIVRFNPFGDTGGDQSFVLAVLDAHDSGYVLTSIHGREGTRAYVKPVDYGKSKYTLSSEEMQALGQASKRIPSKPSSKTK